jgi:hypothetical protein
MQRAMRRRRTDLMPDELTVEDDASSSLFLAMGFQ